MSFCMTAMRTFFEKPLYLMARNLWELKKSLQSKNMRIFSLKKLMMVLVFSATESLLLGCNPNRVDSKSTDDSALIEAGYTRAPVITGLQLRNQEEVIVSGIIMPDGRARFLNDGRAIGFTADSKGKFSALLPVNGVGEVYQFETEDRGRLVKSEGLLFLPFSDVSRATQLRPGAASLTLGGANPAIATIDFGDGKVMSVAGQVQPLQVVTLYVNDRKIAQTQSDKKGQYMFLTDRPETSVQKIGIEMAKVQHEVVVDSAIHKEMSEDQSEIFENKQAWVINWGLVGGGSQTTYIFKSNQDLNANR